MISIGISECWNIIIYIFQINCNHFLTVQLRYTIIMGGYNQLKRVLELTIELATSRNDVRLSIIISSIILLNQTKVLIVINCRFYLTRYARVTIFNANKEQRLSN